MPPKTELPDLIFVSECRTGAMLHHSKIDDIVGLIVDHISSNVIFKNEEECFFYFAVFVIDCKASLHFTKKFMLFSHDEFKHVIDEINFKPLDIGACGLSEIISEVESKIKEFKDGVTGNIKDLVMEYIDKAFP